MVKRFLALLVAAALALPVPALAQAGAQINSGWFWGNPGATKAAPGPASPTQQLDRAIGSTRGSIIERGASVWGPIAPGATAGQAFISQGAGADPVYGLVTYAGGGCGVAISASNGGVFFSGASTCSLLAGTATARLPLLSGASAVGVWGAFTLPASVTSGGVACFTSTTAMGSSALLTLNALTLGGGAGACPSAAASLGTTTTVLHGNAGGAPTFAAIVSADMNITATNCTNQLISAISTGGIGTCRTVVLTSDVTGALPLANGGLGGSQAAATAGQVPVFPGGGGAAVPGTPSGAVGSDMIYNGHPQVDQTYEGGFAFCDGSNNPHTGASQATETYGPDNWRIGCDIGTGRWEGRRVSIPTTVAGLPFLFQATVTTADAAPAAGNHYHLEIPIEGPLIAQLQEGSAQARPITCQFWINAGVAGTYSLALAEGNTNAYTNVQTFSVPSANTSTFIALTFPGDTNPAHTAWSTAPGTIGIKLLFDFGSGSTFQTATLGSWQAGFFLTTSGATRLMATNGNTNYFTGLQCDMGSIALAYRYRSFADDLAAAQTYYTKTMPIGTPVAQNAGLAGALVYTVTTTSTTVGGGANFLFPRKPNIPTIYTFNPSALNTKWRNGGGTDSGTPSLIQPGSSSVFIYNPQVAGDTANGSVVLIHSVANARLGGF